MRASSLFSRAVLQAQSGVMNNKYAEGYPGRRYYGGCENVDIVERLAIDRVKDLFGAEHANVQAHSGAQANMSVYFSLLQHGDTVLGMQLDQGGHLTSQDRQNVDRRDDCPSPPSMEEDVVPQPRPPSFGAEQQSYQGHRQETANRINGG